jgi:hypothetical protein
LNSQKARLGVRTPAAKRGPAMKLGARAIPNLRSAAARHASALERSSLRLAEIGVNDAVLPSICESGFVGGAYGFVWTKLKDKFH